MARAQEFKLILTCDQCGIVNIFDFNHQPETLAPKLQKWLTLGTGAQQQGEDPKYFDDIKCLVDWKIQHDEKDAKFLKQQAEYLANIEKIKKISDPPTLENAIEIGLVKDIVEKSSVTLTDSE